MASPSNGWYSSIAGCTGFSVLRRYTPSRSAGISPITSRLSALRSTVCGRHGPVRYGWSSSTGRVLSARPRISISMLVFLLLRLGGVGADDKARARRGAAPEVERRHGPGALDLVLTRLVRHLLVRVEDHADPGRADRVPATDQAAARVDGNAAATLDVAAVDRLPAL